MFKHKLFTIIMLLGLGVFLVSCTSGVEFTVNFDSNGGSEVTSVTSDGASVVSISGDPTKEGYTFDGWYWDNDTFETPFTANSLLDAPISSNMTVYAKWIPSNLTSYIITYVLNEGVNNPSNPASFDSNTESLIIVDPTKEGYTFGGWYSDVEFATAASFATMPEEDITIYAKWNINSYTLQFVDSDGTVLQTADYEYQADLSGVISPVVNKDGYTFVDWNTSLPLTMPAVNIRLIAQYTVNQYSVTFVTNGGSQLETINRNFGTPFTPFATTKEGYTFVGWYTDIGLLNPYNSTIIPSYDMTVYAKWELETFTITYVLNHGINNSSNPVSYNSSTPNFIFKEPKREGYNFLGWYNNLDFSGSRVDFHIQGSTGTLVLYAKWQINQYDVKYYIYNDYDLSTMIPLNPDETIVDMSLGRYHSSAVTSESRVFTWGRNVNSQLGNGIQWDFDPNPIPIEITNRFNLDLGETITKVSLGSSHSSAITSEGCIFTWGSNSSGQLGNGTTSSRTTPTEITSRFNLGVGEIIISIDLGYDHSSALTSAGRVFTWGKNGDGQLGDGTKIDKNIPTEITSRFNLDAGETIISINLGSNHSSALSSTGRVFTWGCNSIGQLGDGTTIDKTTPTEITSHFNLGLEDTIIGINLGNSHSSALTLEGRVFTWGYNSYGILGDGTTTNRNTPIEITSDFNLGIGEKVISISLGNTSSSALSSTGRVFIWGYNYYGQVDNGYKSSRTTPTEITSSFNLGINETIIGINLGSSHYALLTSIGRIFTWGDNYYGQLGDGTTSDKLIPIEINAFIYPTFMNTETIDYRSNILYEPVLEGYTFNGWYNNAYFTKQYKSMPANNVNLIGRWIINKYQITYILKNGINNTNNPNSYTIESNIITLQNPTKAGYNFQGWYNNESYNGDVITSIPQGSTGDVALFAKWEINQYTLTFNSNEGSMIDAITQDYATTLLEPITTRRGYMFDGWYSDETLTVSYIFTTMPAEDTTIYAKWTPNVYVITYVLNNGEDNIVEVDYAGSELLVPTYDDHEFSGWFTDVTLTIPYESDIFPTSNQILYAKWIPTT